MTIVPFTTTAIINDNTKFEQMDDQLNIFMSDAGKYLYDQLNINLDTIESDTDLVVQLASQTQSYRDTTLGYRDECLLYRNDAVDAKDEIYGYVIPTEATYSPDAIDALVQKQRTELFLGFDF